MPAFRRRDRVAEPGWAAPVVVAVRRAEIWAARCSYRTVSGGVGVIADDFA